MLYPCVWMYVCMHVSSQGALFHSLLQIWLQIAAESNAALRQIGCLLDRRANAGARSQRRAMFQRSKNPGWNDGTCALPKLEAGKLVI